MSNSILMIFVFVLLLLFFLFMPAFGVVQMHGDKDTWAATIITTSS